MTALIPVEQPPVLFDWEVGELESGSENSYKEKVKFVCTVL
jgi:hypothetical protein